MATLEKIRSKSVLLLIVIGVALLAFIATDAINNGRNLFGSGTTIAKVDGEDIDVTEYQRRYEEASRELQNSGRQMDEQMLSENVMQSLIFEKVLNKAVKQMGIEVSSDQLQNEMFNAQNAQIGALAQQLMAMKLNPQKMEDVHDMIFNPKKYGLTDAQVADMQRTWVNEENKVKQNLAIRTYAMLLQGAMKANELDKRAMFDQENISSNTRIAFKPYGEIDAKKYTVSDEELKAKYDEQKNRFRVDEPTKSINLIAMQVTPSDADVKANAELAKKVAGMLRTPGNGSMDKLKAEEGIVSQHYALRGSDVSPMVKGFVTSAPADSVSIVRQNDTGFTIVRNGKSTVEVDSIQLNIIQVAGAKLPAQVLAKLNGGLAVDSLASLYKDSVAVQKEQWIELIGRNGRMNMAKGQIDTLLNAGSNYFIFDQQPQGAVVMKVLKKNAPVQVYEFDQVDYTLYPSTNTIEVAREKLENYLAKNNDPAKFAANAAKEGYVSVPAQVNASSQLLRSSMGMPLPNSRQLVRWVVKDASKGEVSDVFDSNDSHNPWVYAAAVVDEYKEFIPYTDQSVKEYLEKQVRASKYGDDQVKLYKSKGNNIDQIAEAMGVTVDEKDVRLSQINTVGDPAVVGMIVMTKAGSPVQVVKGDNGVFAFQVNNVVDNKLTYNADKYAAQFLGQKHNPDFTRMLLSGKKIKNNFLEFYGGSNK